MYFQPLHSCVDKMNADRSYVLILTLYREITSLVIIIHYCILYCNTPQKENEICIVMLQCVSDRYIYKISGFLNRFFKEMYLEPCIILPYRASKVTYYFLILFFIFYTESSKLNQ